MEKIQGIMRINMKLFGKKCNYCSDRFATHPARKTHETMMHKESKQSDFIVRGHVHENCTRDPCIFCGRGDLTEIEKSGE